MNVIEFPADRINYRERDAANEGDASSIRARATPPANEPDATEVPEGATPLDEATQERMKQIREADRKKVEALLRRDAPTDEGVKPVKDAPKPLKSNVGENTIRPKPLFEKSGYEVPKSVNAQYVAFEGKYLDRKSETVHFEDKGRSLATESESRDVIAHMVEIAKAKNWGELQLKGTEEFRRQAWIAAELAGVPSRGFRPSAQDRAMVQAAREAMHIGAADRSAGAEPKRENTIEAGAGLPAVDRAQDKTQDKGPARDTAGAPSESKTAPAREEGEAQANIGKAAAAPADSGAGKGADPVSRPGVTEGILLEHGAANFEHDPKKNASYFVKVETPQGERTVWGLDLERAIGESGVQPGQRIELEKGGSKLVRALERQFDEKGNELAPKPIESKRNEWHVSSPDVPPREKPAQSEIVADIRREVAADLADSRAIAAAREKFLRGELTLNDRQKAALDAARERIKERAARAVMEDQIKGLKPEDQETVRGEFERAVADARANNRPLDVPMPQVSERTIENVRAEIAREQGTPEHSTPSLEIDQ
jgi:hypothetical protein